MLKFADLLEIYRNVTFDESGYTGALNISSQTIETSLRAIEEDDRTAADSGVFILDEAPTLAQGRTLQVRITPPRLGVGVFVQTLDDLLETPRARFREPDNYYVREGGFSREIIPAPQELEDYRAILTVIALFAEAASYLDELRNELIFIEDGKFTVPIQYRRATLAHLPKDSAQTLLSYFADPTHKDQKLEILARAITTNSRAQLPPGRLEYLLENLPSLTTAVRDGYRLFASNFSYSKIRSELEAAKLEYINKIHKTVTDIQGQLLGIPVATVVVASQLKVTSSCSLELWTDVAIVGGAWIFVALLLVSIANQWLTLNAIKQEIERQRAKLINDYAAISEQFADIFATLARRVCWHRTGLVIVGVIAVVGAAFATLGFKQLVTADIYGCLTGSIPVVLTK